MAEDYDTLSFWFDGVLTVEEMEEARLVELRAAAAQARGPLTSEERSAMLTVQVQKVAHSVHKPVAEKRCTECHQIESSQSGWMVDLPELLYPLTEMCFRCHEPPQGTFVHGPAASGNCSICHSAHTSAYPNLVRFKNMDDTCKKCHDPKDLIEPDSHEEFDGFSCVDCHDPHASEMEYLLRVDYPRVSEFED